MFGSSVIVLGSPVYPGSWSDPACAAGAAWVQPVVTLPSHVRVLIAESVSSL